MEDAIEDSLLYFLVGYGMRRSEKCCDDLKSYECGMAVVIT